MSKEDLFRSYGPGKFDNYATALIYDLSLDGGGSEECGEADTTNWYGLMRGPFDHPQLKKFAGAILETNSQGFTYSEFFTSKKALEKKWKQICKEVAALEDGED